MLVQSLELRTVWGVLGNKCHIGGDDVFMLVKILVNQRKRTQGCKGFIRFSKGKDYHHHSKGLT